MRYSHYNGIFLRKTKNSNKNKEKNRIKESDFKRHGNHYRKSKLYYFEFKATGTEKNKIFSVDKIQYIYTTILIYANVCNLLT